MNPTLSILTPACWERLDQASLLRQKIRSQIIDPSTVEHLVLLDNRTRSVGLKRQALIDSALGDYIAFVDDDDDISATYINELLNAIALSRADVITFEENAFVNDTQGKVIFHLHQGDEPFKPGRITQRDAWHVCAWKREIAQQCLFPDLMDGEDLQWCLQARTLAKTEHHIPRILHTYRFNSTTTLASGKTQPGD